MRPEDEALRIINEITPPSMDFLVIMLYEITD
jgi:hypothetical protein